jgi:DNA cross-link repair 1A protein
VYLDTTYCDEKYTFPPQEQSIDMVVKAVQEEKLNARKTLFCFGAYGIGKEKVYMAAAEALGCKVHVDKARKRTMMCYDWTPTQLACLTVDPAEAPIWVVTMGQLSFNALKNILQEASKHGYSRVVAFRPTGWSFGETSTISKKVKGDAVLYSAPYSEHSSFSELIDFVELFKPFRIVPTVGAHSKDGVKSQLDLIRKFSTVYD